MKLLESVNLYDHQIKAVSFCVSRSSGLVCFTTGSGKSLIMISTAISLTNRGDVEKFFVVVTASSMIELEGDFEKFTGEVPIKVKTVDELRDFMRSRDDKIALVQYNWIQEWGEYTYSIDGKRCSFRLNEEVFNMFMNYDYGICFDEVHCLKTTKSKLSKSSRAIRKLAKNCYGFTATPMTRELIDLFYVVEVIHPGWLGGFNSFVHRYVKFYMMGSIRKIYGYKNLEELNKKLSGLMITYFPEKKIEFISHKCGLTKVEEYYEAARGLFENVDEAEELKAEEELDLVSAEDEDVDEGKTEKTFSARMIDLQRVVNTDNSKVEKFVEVLSPMKDNGVIVYCSYLETVDLVKKSLEDDGFEVGVICGSKTKNMRKNTKVWFNESPQGKALIITRAGGQSLNLQSCPNLVFYECPQNPGLFIQVIGRIVRIGSKYSEFNIHFITVEDTIDAYKFEYMSQNKELFAKVLNNETLPSSDSLKGYNSFIIDKLKRNFLWDRENKE